MFQFSTLTFYYQNKECSVINPIRKLSHAHNCNNFENLILKISQFQ
eukprot:UN09563